MNPIFKGWDPSPERKLLPLWSFNLHFPNFKTTRVFPQRICSGSNVFKFRTLSTWIFHFWSSWSSCTVSELRRDVEPFSSHCFDASSTETRMKMNSGMKWNGWANCRWLLEWIFEGLSWRLLTTLTKQTSWMCATELCCFKVIWIARC